MNGHKIISHVLMWGLILLGIIMAFYFLPDTFLFSKNNRSFLGIVSIPFFVAFVYYLSSAIYFRTKLKTDFKKMIQVGTYGRTAHPTCMTIAIISWIFFSFYPTWQVLMADMWLTLVVFFWIKVEKSALAEKPKTPFDWGNVG